MDYFEQSYSVQRRRSYDNGNRNVTVLRHNVADHMRRCTVETKATVFMRAIENGVVCGQSPLRLGSESSVRYHLPPFLFRRTWSPGLRILSVICIVVQIVSEMFVLVESRNKPCELPLYGWTQVLMIFQVLTVVLQVYRMPEVRGILLRRDHAMGLSPWMPRSFIGDDREDPVTSEYPTISQYTPFILDREVRALSALHFAWYTLGLSLIPQSGSCATTSPQLYTLVFLLLILYYVILGTPTACILVILFCLPVFIEVVQYAGGQTLRPSRAASVEQVSGLPLESFEPETTSTDEERSCVICLSEYEAGDLIRLLPCNHEFHSRCVDHWLRLDKSCPLCKQDIDGEPV